MRPLIGSAAPGRSSATKATATAVPSPGDQCADDAVPVSAAVCLGAAAKPRGPHLALQCHAETSDNIIVHSDADSAVRAAPRKVESVRMPLAVLDHLPDLHGAEFKVLLVLGRHQTRGGGRDQNPFSYSIPQIMEDTGLCPRAISQAISRLDKLHLILRVKKYGALPNRYRVLLEPAAPSKILVAKQPARASKRPKPARVVKASVPELAVVPLKRTGGGRRRNSRPLIQVPIPNLFEGTEYE